MSLSIEPIWSWPLVVLTSVGLTVLVWTTYRTQLKAVPAGTARMLLGLRLLAVVLLILAMFRPAVQKTETDETPVQLLVLADVSRSMNTADMPNKKTRFQAIRADLERLEPRWKEFGKQVEVRQFDFGRELSPFDATLTEAAGEQTAFGKVFDEVLREVRDRRTLGVLLLTDGAYRAMPPFDADPFSAARKLAEAQVTVYPVGYGASSISTAALDLAVEDLVIPEVVFEKNRVPVKAKLRAVGAAGKKVRVRILVEDRGRKPAGESGELKPAPANSQTKTVQEYEIKLDSETIPIELSFSPQLPGELKVGIEVEAAEGELLKGNNTRATIITVKQGGLNVAYFDTARPEQKWLNMVNGADKIQLDFQEVRRGRLGVQTKIDPTWFEPGRYNVFIIGDVPAEVFGPELLKRLGERLEDGAGLLMTGGLQNYGVGGYATTPLDNWLPVELDPADARPAGKVNLATQVSGKLKMLPTEKGQREYVMQLGPPDKNRSLWQDLAPLTGASKLKAKNELIEPWAVTADNVPLLFATTVGRARVAAFAGDTTYLWCTVSKQPDLHQRFWRQMILWLARKEADTDQPVWVKVQPRNLAPGGVSTLTFGARAVDGSPLKEAEFQIKVIGPDGVETSLTPRSANGEYSAEFLKTQAPGDYWVRASAKQGGQMLGFDAFTRFIVDARDLELDYPSADYEFLKQLASITGGSTQNPEELDGLIDRLKVAKLSDLTRIQLITLWDNWWFLMTFVSVMSLEWFLRKKRGLV